MAYTIRRKPITRATHLLRAVELAIRDVPGVGTEVRGTLLEGISLLDNEIMKARKADRCNT